MPLLLLPILPQHTFLWTRIRSLAYYGPTHDCLHSGPVRASSLRGIAADWVSQLSKPYTWHWRVVDTALPPSADDIEAGEDRGRTVGIGVWSMHNVPSADLKDEQKDEEGKEEVEKEAAKEPFIPPELNLPALTSLLGPLRASQPEIMPPSLPPYLMLNQLATHPDHQGRGVGTVLLDWGLEKADKEGLAVYLNATGVGKRMYEKRGFESRKVVEWDREKWGGEGVDRHWCMVREARGVEEMK